MKVQRLSLSNYRGFTQLDLEFGPQITVLAGVNGSGKSAILRALAAVLAHVLREVSPSKEGPEQFTAADVHKKKSALTISSTFTENGRTLHAQLTRAIPNDRKVKSINARRDKARFLLRQTEGDPRRETELLEEIRYLATLLHGDEDHFSWQVLKSEGQTATEEKPTAQPPLAVLYSTNRYLERGFRTSRLRAFEPANAYVKALSSSEVSVSDFANWLKAIKRGALGDRTVSKRLLTQLSEVISNLLPGFSKPRLYEPRPSAREGMRPLPRLYVNKGGDEFELGQLSDGERGLLALAFDLTRRLAIANPGLKNPVAEAEAIVLLDEIELHLHPSWQRTVLARLMDTFKNCQFIATTHSPQVLGEIKADRIWVLDDGPPHHPSVSFADSNWILEHVMKGGASERNADVKKLLETAEQQMGDGNLDAAKATLAATRQKMGGEDGELTRLESGLETLDALAREDD